MQHIPLDPWSIPCNPTTSDRIRQEAEGKSRKIIGLRCCAKTEPSSRAGFPFQFTSPPKRELQLHTNCHFFAAAAFLSFMNFCGNCLILLRCLGALWIALFHTIIVSGRRKGPCRAIPNGRDEGLCTAIINSFVQPKQTQSRILTVQEV